MIRGAAIGAAIGFAMLGVMYAYAPSMPGPFELTIQAIGVVVLAVIGGVIGAASSPRKSD